MIWWWTAMDTGCIIKSKNHHSLGFYPSLHITKDGVNTLQIFDTDSKIADFIEAPYWDYIYSMREYGATATGGEYYFPTQESIDKFINDVISPRIVMKVLHHAV